MRSLEVAIELHLKKIPNLEQIFETYLRRRYSEIPIEDK